jgi:dienelactone hydrolase
MIRQLRRLFLLSALGLGGLALVLAAAVVLTILVMYRLDDRVISLPPPRGPHAVGRSLIQWHDGSRNRDLMVFIWYPAVAGEAEVRCAYIPGKLGEMNAQGMLPIPARRVREIRVNATADPRPAPDRMPVLIMLPGMGRNPANYTTMAEDLASFGNLVMGVTPTGSTAVVFSDGVVSPVREFNPRTDDVQDARHYVDQWSEDASFALDRLMADPRFAGHIVSGEIGVFGHSFGGNVALHLLASDRRITRAADIDGEFLGETLGYLTKPILILAGAGDLGSRERALCEQGVPGSRFHEFPGAKHMNFSDAGILPSRFPIPKSVLMLGDVDGAKLLYETSDQLRIFLTIPFEWYP